MKRVTPPGADVAPLATHDNDGRADPGENVVQALVLGLGRWGGDGQPGCGKYHGEHLLRGHFRVDRQLANWTAIVGARRKWPGQGAPSHDPQ